MVRTSEAAVSSRSALSSLPMIRMSDLLADRRTRATVQVIAIAVAILAVVLVAWDLDLAPVVGVGLLAALSLFSMKSGLIALSAATDSTDLERLAAASATETRLALARVERLEDDARADRAAMSENYELVRRQSEMLELRVDERFAQLLPDAEASRLLMRRTEPALAQLAMLRNEILEIQEAVVRLDRRLSNR